MSQTGQIRTGTIRALLVTTGVFLSTTFGLIVWTYPSFFIFNPFENDNGVRAAMLAALVVAWVIAAAGPVALLSYFAAGHHWPLKVLPFVALAWPVLQLINHVSLWAVEGDPYLGYLLDYPIFLYTDLLLPGMLIAIWIELRPLNHPVRHAVARHRMD
ncbi:MAG: hypothetical protein RLZ88_361 [Actinomycetota bacterium]|jgi:hypothetical protein